MTTASAFVRLGLVDEERDAWFFRGGVEVSHGALRDHCFSVVRELLLLAGVGVEEKDELGLTCPWSVLSRPPTKSILNLSASRNISESTIGTY